MTTAYCKVDKIRLERDDGRARICSAANADRAGGVTGTCSCCTGYKLCDKVVRTMSSKRIKPDLSLLPHVGDPVEYYYQGESEMVQVEEILLIDEIPFARISRSSDALLVLVACSDMEKTHIGWIVDEDNTFHEW